MNNFQRIKSMNINQLAEFINKLKSYCCSEAFEALGCSKCIINGLCDIPKSKTKLWLQQECGNYLKEIKGEWNGYN